MGIGLPPTPESYSLDLMDMNTSELRARQRPPRPLRSTSHPLLFTLMTLTAAAELGLTAFLISAGNEMGTWSSPRYHSLSVPSSVYTRHATHSANVQLDPAVL